MTAYSPQGGDDYIPDRVRGDRRYWAMGGAVGGYHIDVVALTVEDLVRSAGGWLYDRISMGWTVNVLMTDCCDTRPLQILGVRTISPDIRRDSTPGVVYSLAMSADLFGSDVRGRENFVMVQDRGITEITLWGDVLPDMPDEHVTPEQHRLSNAARMFKAQALLAASLPHQNVCPTETLYRCAGSFLSDAGVACSL